MVFTWCTVWTAESSNHRLNMEWDLQNWYTWRCQDFREFSKIFETALMEYSGACPFNNKIELFKTQELLLRFTSYILEEEKKKIMQIVVRRPKRKICYMLGRVQWFWHFFTFWGITTHPWHSKGPRIWKLAKKNFQLHPWPAEIFGKNRKMRFFGLVLKFNLRSPVWQIFTIFSASFIYGVFNTRTKF